MADRKAEMTDMSGWKPELQTCEK